jgi:alpha-tubulin suppressor-like RCC1 family protein
MRDQTTRRVFRGVGSTALVAALVLGGLTGGLAGGLGGAAPAHAWPHPPIFNEHGAVAWGANQSGQIGDRSTVNRFGSTQVHGLTADAKQAAAGSSHSMVLKTDGTVWAWGDNSFGQIGNGTTWPYGEPERVSGLSDVTQISANGTTSMALKSDGTVWAWGANFAGKLGDGTTVHRSAPVQVVGLTGITRIAAGGMHGLALKSDGTVWAWGDSTRGQLGGGNWYGRLTADVVPGLSNVTQIAAGFRHSIALLADQTVRTWGDNSFGQLGNASARPAAAEPVTPIGLRSIGGVAAGWGHSMACQSAGNKCGYSFLYAWGDNSSGQLGDGTTVNRSTPRQITLTVEVLEMSGGLDHTVLIAAIPGGRPEVYAAGSNWAGQLGDGTSVERLKFARVPEVDGVTNVAAGDNHTVAIAKQAPVICCA